MNNDDIVLSDYFADIKVWIKMYGTLFGTQKTGLNFNNLPEVNTEGKDESYYKKHIIL